MSAKKDESNVDVDAILTEIGEFGRSQIVNFVLICLPIALSIAFMYNFIFTSAGMDYR